MDMFRKLYDYKGGRIRLVVLDGEFEGVLKHVYADIGKLSLAKVCPLPKRTPVFPLLHFFTREIKSYSIVSEPVLEEKKGSKMISAADLEVKKHPRQQHNMTKFLHQEAFDPSTEEEDEASRELMNELIHEEEYVLWVPEHLAEKLPLDYSIISKLDNSFFLAIKHIKKQKIIGVGFEGEDIGRYGDLCWITVSTQWCTFLFDVFAMKQNAFNNGLKEILESENILKVIYDCRQPSDALCHQYSTELTNVFDIQVSDAFAEMQNSRPGAVGKYVRSLRHCLIQYLSLKSSDFPSPSLKYSHGISNWEFRPLPNALKDQAIKNVIYLRLLRERTMEKMLKSYSASVGVYLDVVRRATPKELDLEPSVPHMLPQALLNVGLQTFHLKRFPQEPIRSTSELGFEDPVDEDPIQAYLKHVAKEEKKELLMQKRKKHPSSDDQNLNSNGPKNSSGHSKPSVVKHTKRIDQTSHKTEKSRPTACRKFPQNVMGHVKDDQVVNIDRVDVSKSSSSSESEKGQFVWPTIPNAKRDSSSSVFAPAGVSFTPNRKLCR